MVLEDRENLICQKTIFGQHFKHQQKVLGHIRAMGCCLFENEIYLFHVGASLLKLLGCQHHIICFIPATRDLLHELVFRCTRPAVRNRPQAVPWQSRGCFKTEKVFSARSGDLSDNSEHDVFWEVFHLCRIVSFLSQEKKNTGFFFQK